MEQTGSRGREILSSRAVVPSHVVHRGFAHETELLNIRTGQYFGIDRVGGRFLEVIGDLGDLERATCALAEEYGQPLERIREDLAAFVDALAHRGLLDLEPRNP